MKALTLSGLLAAAVLLAGSASASAASFAFGAYTPEGSTSASTLSRFGEKVGRAPEVVSYFRSWSERIVRRPQLRNVNRHGAISLITWEPAGRPLRQITAGAYDPYIRRSAQRTVAWDKPLFVRFAQEMNGDWNPWGTEGNTPGDYVAAWRHVVAIFREEGAEKVRFVWSPNVDDNGELPFASFYPGNDWVNWVALDGYNFGTDGDGWQSFTRVFSSSYRAMNELSDRPLMIAETGSSEDGGSKAAWIRRALDCAIPSHFPRIRALVLFDRRFAGVDARVDSSPRALEALSEALSSPNYDLSAAELLAHRWSPPRQCRRRRR